MISAWRIFGAAVLLTAVIGWMIASRVLLLSSGREIVVSARPIDARELFRGDYVSLTYDFSVLGPPQFNPASALTSSSVFVVLRPVDGLYEFESAAASRPDVPADRIVLRGRIPAHGSPTTVQPAFGIERYFVPEGHGAIASPQIGSDKVDVVLAVGPDGDAAIKALRVNGRDVYQEGLF